MGPVLLLHIGVVILPARSCPGEFKLFPAAILQQKDRMSLMNSEPLSESSPLHSKGALSLILFRAWIEDSLKGVLLRFAHDCLSLPPARGDLGGPSQVKD